MLTKRGRADESDFFARPTGEDNAAPKFFWMFGALPGQRRCLFHDPRDARRIIIRTRMNFVFFAGAIERTAAAVAEMVVMCADQYVFVTAGLRRGRDVRDDVRVVLLQMLDPACEPRFHVRQLERGLNVRVFFIERSL